MKDIDTPIAPPGSRPRPSGMPSVSAPPRRLAVRTVAAAAEDAEECRELLAMLDLDPREGITVAA